MPITVYILESELDGSRYVGMAKELDKRLKEQNAGKNRYTKGHMPWRVIYFEQCKDWKEGRAKEKYYKTASGRKYMEKLLLNNNDQGGSLPA